jgi:hypothetical protein
LNLYRASGLFAAQIIVSWALVKRRPLKFGIGLDFIDRPYAAIFSRIGLAALGRPGYEK